jgi:hypothetical protein
MVSGSYNFRYRRCRQTGNPDGNSQFADTVQLQLFQQAIGHIEKIIEIEKVLQHIRMD